MEEAQAAAQKKVDEVRQQQFEKVKKVLDLMQELGVRAEVREKLDPKTYFIERQVVYLVQENVQLPTGVTITPIVENNGVAEISKTE